MFSPTKIKANLVDGIKILKCFVNTFKVIILLS